MDSYNGDEEYEHEEERVARYKTQACVDTGLEEGEDENGCKCKGLIHQSKNTCRMVPLHAHIHPIASIRENQHL